MKKKTDKISFAEALLSELPDSSGLLVGCMSGTSLDGLDIVACEFTNTNRGVSYQIKAAETRPYPEPWVQKLGQSHLLNADDLMELDAAFGVFTGQSVADFISRHKLQPLAIASHGHTVFHQPEKGFTCQIGCGASIAFLTGVTTINDFRRADVAAGGQGAPLVPVGDALLFGEFDYCLNLGGIANISYFAREKYQAFDVCPFNLVSNKLSLTCGKPFDHDGDMARAGKINPELYEKLGKMEFYGYKGPKSLGREWVERNIFPLFENPGVDTVDALRTFSEHTADVIAKALLINNPGSVLVTGGGAFNKFFIETLQKKYSGKIILPEPSLINFKEALIFALLGWLRLNGVPNTLASVTGAKRNSSGGVIHLGR